MKIFSHLRSGSADLAALFGRSRAVPLSNDTSVGVGFAPFTDLEKVVLAVERKLNDPATKRVHPAIGADIKIMGVRRDRRILLTIACAFVGRFVQDASDYVRKKSEALALALETARSVTELEIDAAINFADDIGRGQMFLTVSGTSAESGDDGEVGRGNRTSGLITPGRPMTMEAAAGKNPVSHVGKLYNLASGRIAEAITTGLTGATDAQCLLVSQIGRPANDPQLAEVSVALAPGTRLDRLQKPIENIVRSELDHFEELRAALLTERLAVY